jgi:hypothetical protein
MVKYRLGIDLNAAATPEDPHAKHTLSSKSIAGKNYQARVKKTGLNESSKNRLRLWLTEHLDDPYPNEDEKVSVVASSSSENLLVWLGCFSVVVGGGVAVTPVCKWVCVLAGFVSRS